MENIEADFLFWVLRTRRPDPNWFGHGFLLYCNEKNQKLLFAVTVTL
jgi:hypothetical protein